MTWERAEAAKAPVAGKVTFTRGRCCGLRPRRCRGSDSSATGSSFEDYIKTGDGSRAELKLRIEASSGSAPRPPSSCTKRSSPGGAKGLGVEGWSRGQRQ